MSVLVWSSPVLLDGLVTCSGRRKSLLDPQVMSNMVSYRPGYGQSGQYAAHIRGMDRNVPLELALSVTLEGARFTQEFMAYGFGTIVVVKPFPTNDTFYASALRLERMARAQRRVALQGLRELAHLLVRQAIASQGGTRALFRRFSVLWPIASVMPVAMRFGFYEVLFAGVLPCSPLVMEAFMASPYPSRGHIDMIRESHGIPVFAEKIKGPLQQRSVAGVSLFRCAVGERGPY
jgi:hypothetical protein